MIDINIPPVLAWIVSVVIIIACLVEVCKFVVAIVVVCKDNKNVKESKQVRGERLERAKRQLTYGDQKINKEEKKKKEEVWKEIYAGKDKRLNDEQERTYPYLGMNIYGEYGDTCVWFVANGAGVRITNTRKDGWFNTNFIEESFRVATISEVKRILTEERKEFIERALKGGD